MLRLLPRSSDPNLLVGFETRDDAGVFKLSETQALVQTVDFFTPIVDDPYAYGSIAAANSLSDVYAMGGVPLTVLNIACFDPTSAPPELWAQVLLGAFDKTAEAGALVMGGHTIEDSQPKFGMAVTGLVDPNKVFRNDQAEPGGQIYLTKPLGSGIVATAAKHDQCSPEELEEAIRWMSMLNRGASEAAHKVGCRCATDITGFGLAGHLFNIARASGVTLEIDSTALPILDGVPRMIEAGMTTGGATRNREFVGDAMSFAPSVAAWRQDVICDPQTSGGLAIFARQPIPGAPCIGRVVEGPAAIRVV